MFTMSCGRILILSFPVSYQSITIEVRSFDAKLNQARALYTAFVSSCFNAHSLQKFVRFASTLLIETMKSIPYVVLRRICIWLLSNRTRIFSQIQLIFRFPLPFFFHVLLTVWQQ
uniref:Uncharacterized protein n=1 Tax=Glossina pallidipes TaxID=7398 RepID=A0A1A9Z6Q4_GLOPL